MIGIVDYNAGNIRSVERALDALGVEFICSKNPSDLTGCERIIFPGDGDAAYAMQQLRLLGFDNFLRDSVDSGKPLLGICVGAQIIFDYSEEGNVECLGFLKGKIRHFENVWNEAGVALAGGSLSASGGASAGADGASASAGSESRKIPHMGWNDVAYANGSSRLFEGVPEHSDFYFIHSYVIQPDDWSVVKGYAEYGIKVPACVSENNITAFQFHPEKSGERGLQILRNFCGVAASENASASGSSFASASISASAGGASC